ncbi:hypothetical protein CKQ90_29440, partial [Klebsiella pneumoniae]
MLPTIYNKYPVRYRDYTLRELCQEMHDLYVSFDVKSLQKEMFRKRSFPRVVMNPQDANHEFIRGNVELVADVLPTIYNKYPVRYRDYTLRELCQEMHDLYV